MNTPLYKPDNEHDLAQVNYFKLKCFKIKFKKQQK
jgi:hypothetical protein